MRASLLCFAVILSYVLGACSGSVSDANPHADAGGAGQAGNAGSGGGDGGLAGVGGTGGMGGAAGTAGTGGMSADAGDAGDAGSGALTYCERWAALGPGALPGFATDSVCTDFSDVPVRDAECSGASNASATIARVELAQNHVLTPSGDDYTTNDSGDALDAESVRPKFRLISHRPAQLLVSVTGSGASPEVRVTARRNEVELGSLCLSGPSTLPSADSVEPSFDNRFTVSLPAAWIRSGLELTVQAGDEVRELPATQLRVAGGLRHLVVQAAVLLYGDTTPHYVPHDDPDVYVMADELPVQSAVWARFPVPIRIDPFTMSARSGNSARIVPAHEGSFDEVGEMLDTIGEIWRANGHVWEAGYFASMKSSGDSSWGGGLGGTNGAAGPASQLMIRHESGHAYGLPHMEDGYADRRYPFAKRSDGSGCVLGVPGEDGCGVGPNWKFFQSQQLFESPWDDEGAGVYKRDPMGGGGNNWFGAYTDQWLLDYMQDRIHWDDELGSYVSYDAASGELQMNDDVEDDNWYERPEQRDVPLYTVFGSFSDTVSEVNVIQPPLHYRGHLLRTMDPTKTEDLQWLKDHDGRLCGNGCDLVLRVIYDGSTQRNFLIKRGSDDYVRWAINVPDEGTLTRAELYLRPLDNGGGGNVDAASASTYLDGATLVAERDF